MFLWEELLKTSDQQILPADQLCLQQTVLGGRPVGTRNAWIMAPIPASEVASIFSTVVRKDCFPREIPFT
jgi:hypothetical protein